MSNNSTSYSHSKVLNQLNFGNVAHLMAITFMSFSLLCFMMTINALANDKVKKVVFLGDSLVAGYSLPLGAGVVEQLEKLLNKDAERVKFVNAGVSGDTTAAGLARLDWSVGDDVDVVFLELGANDALRGSSPKAAEENLTKIIERLKERGIDIYLAGMLAPPNMGEGFVNQFNAIYPTLAKKYDLPFYPFFMEGVATRAHLVQADGLHPNEAGVAELVKRLTPFFEKQLEK